MNNVTDISTARRKSYKTASIDSIKQEVKSTLSFEERVMNDEAASHSIILKDLDALAEDMLVRRLSLIHTKEAAARGWAIQEADMAAELEAAAFLAVQTGVPEEAIHELNYEPLSDALSSAQLKVQSA